MGNEPTRAQCRTTTFVWHWCPTQHLLFVAAGAEKVGTRLHDGVSETAVVCHQVGVGLDDPPKFKSLKTIVEELGHVNRTIDIFKIDCEGEFARAVVCGIFGSLYWQCSNVHVKSNRRECKKNIASYHISISCFVVVSACFGIHGTKFAS